MFVMNEEPSLMTIPKKISGNKSKIRMEVCLQTSDDINRNKRRYGKGILEAGVGRIAKRIQEGTFFGELDHPISKNPSRQFTVLYKNVSHRIMETYWKGNKLIGIVETLRTPKGRILKNLAEDGIPVGFSMRGMGDLRPVTEGGVQFMEVIGPLNIISWDTVSYPSHASATMIKITESVQNDIAQMIHEATGIQECDGYIKTEEGLYYLPDDFDQLVEKRIIKLVNKFKV